MVKRAMVKRAMIKGSCLCGAVQFQVAALVEPFELCHCQRCRKVSGSAYMAAVTVLAQDFQWLKGQESISVCELPLVEAPPAYRVCFCSLCGSPTPDPDTTAEQFEIPAGLLEGDTVVRPDKHIYIEHKAPWHTITDQLPQFDKVELYRHRFAHK